ncbi:MAG: malectin domain-containing carbohydrate-binding protein [Cyanophyceae cyanobacterium]
MSLSPEFNQVEVDLKGNPLNNPTSLQFGPDGRLYVSQQDGLIRSYSLKPILDQNGNITKLVINNKGGADKNELVQNIPNHDDDGALNESVNNRQVTGLVVDEGANGEVVLYVSSSDPRIGGGKSGSEKNLDTNSGIISRLTKTGNTWEKVDLVIGLPRSEENHSTNGMDIRTEMVDGEPHQIMYVVSGGNTNRGAPSNNFAWTSEYYYSAAVLRIDLTQLEQIEAAEGLKGGTDYVDPYVYALPTLNDPTRPDNDQGQDTAAGTTGLADAEAADTFGGNDGRNQAKYDPNGPVQIYSMGYRNAYDIVITENDNIYTFDNGPNNGWGDVPLTADGTPVTDSSQVATNTPNIDVNTGNDNDPDNLHLVTEGFYAGHPNPVYASGPAAGLYWVDTSSGSPVVKQLTDPSDPNNDPTTLEDDLPSDWNEIAGGVTNPDAGVYLTPGDNPYGTDKGPDNSLVTIDSSSNGLAEYIAGKVTGSNPVTDVPGAEVVVVVAFNGNIYFMEIVGDGTQAGTNLTDISPVLIGGTPLDVRDVEAFAVGTEQFKDALFIAKFGSDSLTALVPGTPPPTDIDKDDDGLEDNIDPLQYDPVNGTNTLLNPDEILFWDFNPADSGVHPGPSGEYNIGMTGWMVNGSWLLEEDGEPAELFSDPSLTDLNNTIRGGAPGIFQVKSVGTGDLEGGSNDQQDAMQTGFLPAADVSQFTIKVPVFNPFTSDANNGVSFSESASMGVALGDGTMSNWLGIAVAADDSTGAQVKFSYEENDSSLASLATAAPDLLNAIDDDLIELFLTVDTDTLEVIPSWRYQTQGAWSDIIQLGNAPVPLTSGGTVAQALQGQNTINGIQSAPVITLTSTSQGAQPFTADFLDLTVATPQVLVEESGSQTQVTEGGAVATYSLVLSTQPTSDVTVSLSPNAQVTLDKAEVVFTPTNWAAPQQVTITAVDDSDSEGSHTGQITHQLSTNDSNYAQVNVPNLVVEVVDNDVPQVLLVETDGLTEVAEGGFTDTYSLVLSTQPTSDVTVSLSPNSQVTLDQSDVVFTPANWDTPQQVTITAVDDSDSEGSHTGQITHQLSTNDSDYAQVNVPNLAVNVVDNDESAILYRVNVGGEQVASADGSTPDWSADTSTNPSSFRVGSGGSKVYTTADAIDLSDPSLLGNAPEALFQSERWDPSSGANMQWAFPVDSGSDVEVRLYFAEIYKPIVAPNQRVFDVSVEGDIPSVFDNIDPYEEAGYGGLMLSHTLTVSDSVLNLEFLHDIQNPALKGIEILSSQVLDEVAPTITTATSVTVPENQTAVVDVNATDANGDSEGNGLTYSLTGGVDQGSFAIDSNTGSLSFATAPDFEEPSDDNSDNVYTVEVMVTDSTGLTDAQLMSVTVSDVNENESAPTITTADSVTVPENQTEVVDIDATDANGDVEGNGLTYQPLSGPDAALFELDPDTGELSFINAPDFENPLDNDGDNIYQLEAIVEDSTGLTDLQTIGVTVSDVNETGNGEAVLTITPGISDVQESNFGNNSFQITNTGQKKIAQVDIDVTDALYPDTVFDPFGEAGDTASKSLTINTNGDTGVVAPSNNSYVGAGGTAGYEGLRLTFDETVDGGFENGETVGFAVDMDPNSVAGTQKSNLDAGSAPAWDVGGVSGAELIGSTFTVTFTDGTTATGQLQGDGSQAGSQALASSDSPELPVSLAVNGLGAGDIGTYDSSDPSVVVNGPDGQTARVVLTKGFIQPVDPYAPFLADQLEDLAASVFPANNAVEFQTVDVTLTGENQEISNQFDFSGVANYDFPGEDQLPLGFVASVIDPTNDDLPLGSVTQPIYLQFEEQSTTQIEVSLSSTQDAAEPDSNGQFTVSLSEAATTDTVISYSVEGTATPDDDYTALSGTVTISAGELAASIDVAVLDDQESEGNESVEITLDAITAGDSDVVLDAADTATIALADDDGTAAGPVLLHRINVGGPAVAAADGSTGWSEDTSSNPSTLRVGNGGNKIATTNAAIDITGQSVPASAPEAIFQSERWDPKSGSPMKWELPVEADGDYEVRLFFAENYSKANAVGKRVFDVEVEGSVPAEFDDIDQFAIAGLNAGFALSHTTTVNDNSLSLEFLHNANSNNPALKGIEVFAVDGTIS